MADITVDRSAVFSGGKNELITIALATATNQPLPESASPLALSIGADAATPVKIGAADSAKLSVSAEATAALTPVWSSTAAAHSQQLQAVGLDTYFATHADELLLLLELGA